MGAQCFGGDDQVIQAGTEPHKQAFTSQKALALCKESDVLKYISAQLGNLTFTDAQLYRLAAIAVEGLVKVQTDRQPQEQKAAVEKILGSPDIIEKLEQYYQQQGTLFYNDVLEMVRKQVKQSGAELCQGSRCRIYQKVTSLKSQQFDSYEIKNQMTEERGQISFKPTAELDEYVRNEELAAISRKMGEQVSLVMDQLEQQTNSITTMLKETQFDSWDYDLEQNQVTEVAQIASQATAINQDGVLMLIEYLGRAMSELAKKGQSAENIEQLMVKRIKNLSASYPPGKGLQKDQQNVKEALKKLELKDKSQAFQHKPTTLTGSSEQRKRQLDECILHYAKVAEKQQTKFEQMIKNTCLKKAISFSVNLKVNPNKPNSKVILRIKEKLLYKNKTYDGQVDPQGKLLEQVLEEQEQVYNQELGRLLDGQSEVVFSVSDMVRGKCTFTSIGDIIQTVQDIKQYSQVQPGLRITEVESRFTLDTPISDVTLKIVLDQQIVSELQLTLQLNAAAYHFAHVIYEINRSKIFSKSKMTDNILKENHKRVNQLIKRALLLKEKLAIPPEKHSRIRSAYGLDSSRETSWQQAIGKTLDSNQTLKKSPVLYEKLNEENSLLMSAVFRLQNRQLKSQDYKHIIITGSPQSPKEAITQAVVLQQVFKRLDLAADMKSGFYFLVGQYIRDLLQISLQSFAQVASVSFMLYFYCKGLKGICIGNNEAICFEKLLLPVPIVGEGLVLQPSQLKQIIDIVDALAHYQSQRFQQYSQQLQGLLQEQGPSSHFAKLVPMIHLKMCEHAISKGKMDSESLKKFQSLRNQLIGQEALLLEWQLWNLALIMSISRNKGESDLFKSYQQSYQQVMKLAQSSFSPLSTVGNATAHWLIAQQLEAIQHRGTQQQAMFDAQQQHLAHVVQCGITPRMAAKFNLRKIVDKHPKISALIHPNQETIQIFYELLNPAHNKSLDDLSSFILVKWPNLKSLHLSNDPVTKRRHAQVKQAASTLVKQTGQRFSLQTLVSHSKISQELNQRLGLLVAKQGQLPSTVISIVRCQQNNKSRLLIVDQSQLTTTGSVQYQFQQNRGKELSLPVSSYLAQNYPLQSKLNSGDCEIGDQGCKFLSQANWTTLSNIDLRKNNIGVEGCQWLSKTAWPSLTSLRLRSKSIDDAACEWIAQANWPLLECLHLNNCRVTDKGVQVLSKATWPRLKDLNLSGNSVQMKVQQILQLFHQEGKSNLNMIYL